MTMVRNKTICSLSCNRWHSSKSRPRNLPSLGQETNNSFACRRENYKFSKMTVKKQFIWILLCQGQCHDMKFVGGAVLGQCAVFIHPSKWHALNLLFALQRSDQKRRGNDPRQTVVGTFTRKRSLMDVVLRRKQPTHSTSGFLEENTAADDPDPSDVEASGTLEREETTVLEEETVTLGREVTCSYHCKLASKQHEVKNSDDSKFKNDKFFIPGACKPLEIPSANKGSTQQEFIVHGLLWTIVTL